MLHLSDHNSAQWRGRAPHGAFSPRPTLQPTSASTRSACTPTRRCSCCATALLCTRAKMSCSRGASPICTTSTHGTCASAERVDGRWGWTLAPFAVRHRPGGPDLAHACACSFYERVRRHTDKRKHAIPLTGVVAVAVAMRSCEMVNVYGLSTMGTRPACFYYWKCGRRDTDAVYHSRPGDAEFHDFTGVPTDCGRNVETYQRTRKPLTVGVYWFDSCLSCDRTRTRCSDGMRAAPSACAHSMCCISPTRVPAPSKVVVALKA